MTTSDSSSRLRQANNPFTAQRIQPGARPFLFSPGLSLSQLLDQLRAYRWRAQIVGPHGAGKSSLLWELREACAGAGRDILSVTLHRGDRRLPSSVTRQSLSSNHLLAIDGYEQLSHWSRIRLARGIARVGCGLLVTTHKPVRLPVLYRCEPSVELLRRVVEQMLQNAPWTISDEELSQLYRAEKGDLRECLFQLYDRYRQG